MKQQLQEVENGPQLRACYPAMRELRPHIESEEDFLARATRMGEQGYRILAAWEGEQVVALAGYRLQENLVYGRFLYVDDLVARETHRGQGWGARLLEQLTATARQAGCARLVLDTGLANALAQRFYFRQGLLTGALRFGKALTEVAA